MKTELIRQTSRRDLTVFLLLLFSSAFTVAKGQTVNYIYDASGNVTSKQVVQPLRSASISAGNDSIRLFHNFLTDDHSKLNAEPGQASFTLFETVIYNANATSSKQETPVTANLSGNTNYSQITAKRKTTSSNN